MLVMLNLFAHRSTDPYTLGNVIDPVGPANDGTIIDTAAASSIVVAAWGAHPMAQSRGIAVASMLGCQVWCLGTTKDGSPRHPLYLRCDAPLVFYRGKAVARG